MAFSNPLTSLTVKDGGSVTAVGPDGSTATLASNTALGAAGFNQPGLSMQPAGNPGNPGVVGAFGGSTSPATLQIQSPSHTPGSSLLGGTDYSYISVNGPYGGFVSEIDVVADTVIINGSQFLSDGTIANLKAKTTVTTTGCTAAAGFTLTTFVARQFGSVVTVLVVVNRSGAAITADAAGNIIDTLIATLPAGLVPVGNVLVGSYDKGGIADGSVSLGPDGKATLKTLSPTATIATGDLCTFSMTFVQ